MLGRERRAGKGDRKKVPRVWKTAELSIGCQGGLDDKVTFNSGHGINPSRTLYFFNVGHFITISKWS